MKHRSGLTLIELLTAMTIFSVVVTVTIAVFLNFQKMHRRMETKRQVETEANRVMYSLEQSLRLAYCILSSNHEVISFLNADNDTVCWGLSGDSLILNTKRITCLLVDTLSYVFYVDPNTRDGVDLSALDSDRTGYLDATECKCITGIGVYIRFRNQVVNKKSLIVEKYCVIQLRNCLR